MTQKHITKLLTAKDSSFVYDMTKSESLTVNLIIVSSVSFAATCTITMHAKKGSAIVRCIVVPSKKAVISLTTCQSHIAPYTKSDMLIRSVIMDSSSVSFQGNVYIGSNARKADAYQKNENLILGDGGVITASPILEILHNDVKCSHGVTTGTIPQDVLWYLGTRGVSEQMVKALYIDGFIRDSIGDIQDKKIVKKLVF